MTKGYYGKAIGPTIRYGMRTRLRRIPYKRGRAGSRLPVSARPRMRMGTGRSYTRTKTRRQKRRGRIDVHGDNASSSACTIASKRPSRFIKMLQRKITGVKTVHANIGSTASSASGLQFAIQFPFLTVTDLNAIDTAVGAPPNAAKAFLKTGKQVIMARNQSNSNAKLNIYDIVVRKDPPSAILDQPTEAWEKGMADMGAGANSALIVGATPFKSPEFRNYFRVVRSYATNVEPGMTHTHTVFHKYNKVLNTVRFQNNSTASAAGLTRFVMMVWHGQPVHEAGAVNTVSIAACKFDFVRTTSYSYGSIPVNTPTYTTGNTLAAVLAENAQLESGDVDANVMQA